MAGFLEAASVIAIINTSAKIISLCFQYSTVIKDSRNNIGQLQWKVSNIKDVFKQIEQLLKGQDKILLLATYHLLNLLKKCLLQIEELEMQLESSKTCKAMSRLGVQALTWLFTSKKVEKCIASLKSYERIYTLAFLWNQT